MAHGTIVFLGGPQVETAALGDLVPEFGWSLEIVVGLDGLRELSGACNLIAVLFDAHGLGLSWKHALALVQEAASPALPIPCHRLSDRVNWPELAEAGAFHALALPFDRSEVRQSLGFVSVAGSRPDANVLSISSIERLGAAVDERAQPAATLKCRCVGRCHCSGNITTAAESVA